MLENTPVQRQGLTKAIFPKIEFFNRLLRRAAQGNAGDRQTEFAQISACGQTGVWARGIPYHQSNHEDYILQELRTEKLSEERKPIIANRLRACFSDAGVHLPVICTPEQFFTDDHHHSNDQSPEDA